MMHYCKFCEVPLTLDTNECTGEFHNENVEAYITRSQGSTVAFGYSTESIAKAMAFATEFPEFRDNVPMQYYFDEHKQETVRKFRDSVSVGYGPENADYLIGDNYDDFGCELSTYESNVTATDITREDEWQGIYDNQDNYQRDAKRTIKYKDVEPLRATYSLARADGLTFGTMPAGTKFKSDPAQWHYMCSTSIKGRETRMHFHATYKEREVINHDDLALTNAGLDFEVFSNMNTEEIIDLNITEKFQHKFFNVYVGKDFNLHIGLLTFNIVRNGVTGDLETIEVTCSHRGCNYGPGNAHKFRGEYTRENMESFVIACIRHGNMHAPAWIRNRKDYTVIHAQNCDCNHASNVACNGNQPGKFFSTGSLDDSIDFLIQHRKFCRNTECRCTHYYHLLNERTYAA
jgi:hypothetical protein